ncbi:hypothetical protein BV497_12335 [Fulvimonas soli]|nr:hypothetical protein BV497_12335 [Fulvimonas soli]
MRVTPSALRECEVKPGVGVAVQVAWDASRAGVTTTKAWVQAPGGERKLWTAGGATGSQTTGPWTSPGTTFVLTDGGDRTLAQATIAAVPCK